MIQKFRHVVHITIAFFTDLFGLCKALFYQLQRQHFRREIRREVHERPLFILANGPSLAKVLDSVKGLNNVDFCVVNLSANTDVFWVLKPKMYVITDMSLYVNPDKKIFQQLRENIFKIDWDIEFYLPFHYPDWAIKWFTANSHITVYRYTTETWSPENDMFKNFRLWLYKQELLAPACTNVLIAAIYVSLLRGYKRIYLFGADHSWLKDIRINDNNQVVVQDAHYYGTVEHVWLDYQGNPISITDLLESNLSTFRNHHNLRAFADYLGDVKIINCTEGSYIDAYERGKLEDIINGDSTN